MGCRADATRDLIADFAKNHSDLKIRVVDNKKQIIPAALNVAIGAATRGVSLCGWTRILCQMWIM